LKRCREYRMTMLRNSVSLMSQGCLVKERYEGGDQLASHQRDSGQTMRIVAQRAAMAITSEQVYQATHCGSCSLCCKILIIAEEPEKNFKDKPWNTWCPHCKPGNAVGGCTRHEDQPEACSAFQCVWYQSHQRNDVPSMPMSMKPQVSHIILIQSQEDYNVIFAFCDLAYPRAWHEEPMRSYLIRLAETGIVTVIVVLGRKRYLMTKGRPNVELTEDQLVELADGSKIKINTDYTDRAMLSRGYEDEPDRISKLLSSVPALNPPQP
jgi:thiol-disulfide isomerase/thioredoxin